jgi:hypothetical protein
MGQQHDNDQLQIRSLMIARFFKGRLLPLALIALAIVAYDVFRWHSTLARIRLIEQVQGMPVSEAKTYLEDNRKKLRIVDITVSSHGGRQRIVVVITGLSIIGGLYSLLLSDILSGSFEISGLILLSVEDERVSSSHLVW